MLHVSSAQAGACLERYGDIDSLSAPELPSLDEALTNGVTSFKSKDDSSSSAHGTRSAAPSSAAAAKRSKAEPTAEPSGNRNSTGTAQRSHQQQRALSNSRAGSVDRVVNEALCLATPEDPTELDGPARQVQPVQSLSSRASSVNRGVTRSGAEDPSPTLSRLQARGAVMESDSNTTTSSGVLQEEAEELLQLEGAAFSYQYSCSSTALYAREALQASAAVRRRRRRKLVRMLREGRALTASGVSVLASIGSSISSIGSWDDELAQGLDESSASGGDDRVSGGGGGKDG